jgi:hypothetical protein
MPRVVKLDLRGAPPVTGGMRDKIPAGHYRCQVVKVEDTTSKTGKRMWVGSYRVCAGEQTGANLGDNFVLVDNTGAPSKLGLGRVHHFLLCLGLNVKEAAINFDLDMLNSREFEVDVLDGEFTATDGKKVATSEIKRYSAVQGRGQQVNGGNGAVHTEPEASPAAAPVTSETAVAEVEAEDDGEEISLEVDELFK